MSNTTTPTRNIGDVIDTCIKLIPTDQQEFIERLNWLKNDASYKPPEMMINCWHAFQGYLVQFIGEMPTLEWHVKVLSVFSTIPEETIKTQCNLVY